MECVVHNEYNIFQLSLPQFSFSIHNGAASAAGFNREKHGPNTWHIRHILPDRIFF